MLCALNFSTHAVSVSNGAASESIIVSVRVVGLFCTTRKDVRLQDLTIQCFMTSILKGGYHAKKYNSYLDFIGGVGLVDFLS